MIKAISFITLLGLTSAACALDTNDPRQEPNEAPYSKLCLAALDSDKAMKRMAVDLRMTRGQMRKVTCNGVPIESFARLNRPYLEDNQVIVTVQ